MKENSSLWVRLFFFAFSLSGIGVAAYLTYDIMKTPQGWSVEVAGELKPEQKKEIQETILYFVKINKNRIDKKAIQDILSLNPRIKKVTRVDISLQKTISIEVKLKKTAYIGHDPKNHRFQEVSTKEETLEEDIKKFDKIDAEIPILCLTDNVRSGKGPTMAYSGSSFSSMKRDIISAFRKTRAEYAFIWRYISEICLGEGYYRYIIYSTHVRSRIETNEKFDRMLLRRLWAVFFYLNQASQERCNEQSQSKPCSGKFKWAKVRLNEYNAQVHLSPFSTL